MVEGSPDLSDLPLAERIGISQLVTSLTRKLPFTAPEILEEKVRIYIESAWIRGRSAGLEEARLRHCESLEGQVPTGLASTDKGGGA